MNKKVEELKREIIGHKQIIEQLELDRDKAWNFVESNYPTINSFDVKDGWQGGGMATYRVTIDVLQEGKDIFEYSVFGSPNQKIGKFANQKSLGEWS